jgi:hypothetical protein
MSKIRLLLLLVAVACDAAPKPQFVTNNDTTWKVYHPSLILNPAYAACLPFFKDLVQSGADVSFLPWPADQKFATTLRSVFPGEKEDFYRRFHRVEGLPPGQEEDIWTKDYLVFCEAGDRCTMVRATDKSVLPGEPAVLPEYDRQKLRAQVNEAIAQKYEIPIARWDLRFEGGNIANAGNYVLMAKSNLNQPHIPAWGEPNEANMAEYWKNIQSRFEAKTKELTGRELLWLEPLPEEGTGHIDMFLTVVGDTILLGELSPKLIADETDEQRKKHLRWIADILDHNARILTDKGLKVTRMPMPAPFPSKMLVLDENNKEVEQDALQFPTFSNSIQVNVPGGRRTVFCPTPTRRPRRS